MQLNQLIKELSQENILSPENKTCIVRVLSRKETTWIFDYYKKGDNEGYVIVKNPIKDKRY